VKVITKFIFLKDRTEEIPLIVVAKVFEGPVRPFVVVEGVILYKDLTIRPARESFDVVVIVGLAVDRKGFVLELMLIKLINQFHSLTPDEYRKYDDRFVVDK
jgi:hypothetical protein